MLIDGATGAYCRLLVESLAELKGEVKCKAWRVPLAFARLSVWHSIHQR